MARKMNDLRFRRLPHECRTVITWGDPPSPGDMPSIRMGCYLPYQAAEQRVTRQAVYRVECPSSLRQVSHTVTRANPFTNSGMQP
jgi:hypothetical protein